MDTITYMSKILKKTGRKAVKDKTLDGLKAKVLAYEHETMAQAKRPLKGLRAFPRAQIVSCKEC